MSESNGGRSSAIRTHLQERLHPEAAAHGPRLEPAGPHEHRLPPPQEQRCSRGPERSPDPEDVVKGMPGRLDCIDEAILRQLEADSRLTADAIARRIGARAAECAARITELERAGHIGGYTIVRNHPGPVCRPVSAVIKVAQDPARNGSDLLRSLDFIPEVATAEILEEDRSLLLRLQTTEPARVEEIAASLRIQSAVLAVHATATTLVLSRTTPMAPAGRPNGRT